MKINTVKRPQPGDCADFYQKYIDLVIGDDLHQALKDVNRETQALLLKITEERGDFAYAEGKWTVKEVIQHLIDTERIFCYRALTFARGDKTELPGFDHDIYVTNTDTKNRTIKSLATEFEALRKSTIALFGSFSEQDLDQKGTANKLPQTVLSLGYIIAGHEIHHRNVLKEKYL